MRSNFLTPFKATLVFACLIFCSLNVAAQTAAVRPARVTQPVDDSNLVMLHGNTHPLARAKYDQGPASDSLPMNRMLMVLQRSPDQQVALKALMDGQQSKSSANYHQWLTPEQFGEQFGVADSDIQAVTGWLQTHGFQVNRVATGKMLIEFSGTAGQIKEAFHTQIHKYLVNGEEHVANASDPQIPAALAPVVKGINSMHNFRKKPAIHSAKALRTSLDSGTGKPQFTVTDCNINGTFSNPTFNNTCFGVSPGDFAKIYNVPTTFHSSPLNGAGQTVAVVGDSDICTGSPLPAGCVADDVVAFRNLFGLPGNNTQVYVDGSDPGLNGDELEAALDVEWVGAVAQGAKVLFVTAGNTESSAGIDLAAERIVDNNLGSVMTESFGGCEQSLGNSGNNFYATLYEQAAAQGITVILAVGDSGSAGCDDANSESEAINGVAVSGFASTPFAVAVGGTDFDYTALGYPGTYWNTSTTANTSAKSYIQETTWNDTCGQSQPPVGINSNCVSLTTQQQSYLLDISGGGGGQSDCAFESEGICYGYITPPWQVGVGVPTSGFRYVPDLSLFAAFGEVSNSFYVVCESDLVSPSPSCTGNDFAFIPVGGTSASAQAFGGIMALVNQAMASSGDSPRQGNANYELYPLFAAQTTAGLNCNSSLFTPTTPLSTGCTFNDITKGTNTVFCAGGSLNCNSSTLTLTQYNSAGTALTSTPAYPATTGFDEATGLGSINVTNLVTNWVNQAASFAPTTTTLCLSLTQNPAPTSCTPPTSAITFQHGTRINVSTAVTSTAGSNLCGDVALIGSNTTFPPNNGATAGVDHFNAVTGNDDIYTLENPSTGACTGSVQSFSTELIGGTYNISAHFPGYNDGTGKLFGVSDSPTFPVSITPEPSTTAVTVLYFNEVTGAISSLTTGTSVPYGSALGVRVDVASTATPAEEDGTGNITIKDSGNAVATIPLNSEGYTDFYSPMFNFPGNLAPATTIPAFAVGSHSFSATFPGDPSYSASSSATPVALTVAQAPTYPTISGPTSAGANAQFSLTVLVDSTSNPFAAEGSLGNAPTGTVTFFNGAIQIGSAVPVTATFDANGFVAAQATGTLTLSSSATITAKYSGDTNYLASTSAGYGVTVAAPPTPTFTLAPGTNPVTFAAGTTGASVITVAPVNGFTGTVGLTCSVTSPTSSMPPCSLSANSVVLGAGGTVTLSLMTTATTVAGQYVVSVLGVNGSTVITSGVTFSVTGVYSITPVASSFTAAAPGQSGTLTVSAMGTAGLPYSVSFSASVAATSQSFPPFCSFLNTSPITLTQAAPSGSATLTCTTTAANVFLRPDTRPEGPRWLLPGSAAAATLAFALFLLWMPSLRKKRGLVFAGLALFIAGAVCVGCGGSSGGGTTITTPPAGTNAGSYTVTITATGGGTSQTMNVTFVLQ
jgi:hypothetical protein